MEFSTDSVRPQDRLAYWKDVVCAAFVHLDVDSRVGADFSASLSMRAAGDCQLIRVRGVCQSVTRTDRIIEEDGDEHLIVMFQRRGQAAVIQDGRQTVMAPGSLAMMDSRRPYRLSFPESFEQSVIKVPARAMQRRLGMLHGLTARALPADTAACKVFQGAVEAAAATPKGALEGRLSDPLLDLLAMALVPEASTEAKALVTAPARVARAKTYIHANLRDPDLRPEQVAHAQSISLRLLQRLFAREGLGLSELIVELRLEQCRAALIDPLQRMRSVSDIAYAAGFADLSHFSRAFRRRYGASASELRAQAAGPVRCAQAGEPARRR